MSHVKRTIAHTLTAMALFAVMPAVASANEIALTFKNGSVTIRGDFVGFHNNAYLVATAAGHINVPAKHITCEGQDCIVILSSNAN